MAKLDDFDWTATGPGQLKDSYYRRQRMYDRWRRVKRAARPRERLIGALAWVFGR